MTLNTDARSVRQHAVGGAGNGSPTGSSSTPARPAARTVRPAKLRLKPPRKLRGSGVGFAAGQRLFAPLRGARHLLRPGEKLASSVTIVALRDV